MKEQPGGEAIGRPGGEAIGRPGGEAKEPAWLDELEERAWRSLQLMQLQLNAALMHDLAAHSKLGYQDYMVLVVLTAQPEGAMRLFQLGRDLAWEKSRLSHQVSRMAERGLVRKFACGSDRRGQFVEVTATGRAEIEAAAPSHVAAVRRLFIDRLPREQLAHVADLAGTVLAALEEEFSKCDRGQEECPASVSDGGAAHTARP